MSSAQLIQPTHSKTCDICMLLDTEAKDMKWHLYDKELVSQQEHHICNDCMEGLMDIRKRCHQKFDNPKHKFFENYMPWFVKEIPGMVDAFKRNVETITP